MLGRELKRDGKGEPKDGLRMEQADGSSSERRKKNVLEAISEGRKMEAYAEHRTKDMHVCALCETICYRKKAGKAIGKKWFCVDCLRLLKETMETFGQWEEEIALEAEMKKQLDNGLGD